MPQDFQRLTPRQLEILRHTLLGRSAKDTSKAMNIGIKSVEAHRYRMMRNLGVTDRFELFFKAMALGILTVDDFPVVSTVDPSCFNDRQMDVLIALATGESPLDIAKRIGINKESVDTHQAEILDRLGLQGRLAITHYAFQQGLIGLDESGGLVASTDVPCPDCDGSGKYVGLNVIESCARCGGNGRIRRAA